MFKNFYKILASAKIDGMDLFSLLEIADRNGKLQPNDRTLFEESNGLYVPRKEINEPIFISDGVLISGQYQNYEANYLIYKDLFFKFLSYGKNAITIICMKRPEDAWKFEIDSNYHAILLDPVNVNTQVYIAYDVEVLGIDRCSGQKYKSGAWNKVLYKEFSSLVEEVRSFKNRNKVEEAYQK